MEHAVPPDRARRVVLRRLLDVDQQRRSQRSCSDQSDKRLVRPMRVKRILKGIVKWTLRFVSADPWLVYPLLGMCKPKDTRLGVDYAGTVEAFAPASSH